MKNILISFGAHSVITTVLAGLLLASVPQTAAAQAFTYSRTELVAEIQRLLVELARRDAVSNVYYYQPTSYTYTNPTQRVLGVSTSGVGVEVETLRAIDTEDDEASVYGNVDLNGQSYADVWFEFGDDDNRLTDRSRMGRIDRNDQRTFRADLDNLDEDEQYYYRAVAQGADGRIDYGVVRSFFTDDDNRRSNDDEPDAETDRAFNINEDNVRLAGEVDMNDFRNGRVFFVYGEDEDQVEEIAGEYDEYRDIDEDGDDLQVVLVDSDLDTDANYEARVFGLDDDTEHFFQICVEYEDDDDDEVIECGGVEDFETDRD